FKCKKRTPKCSRSVTIQGTNPWHLPHGCQASRNRHNDPRVKRVVFAAKFRTLIRISYGLACCRHPCSIPLSSAIFARGRTHREPRRVMRTSPIRYPLAFGRIPNIQESIVLYLLRGGQV